MFQHGNTLAKRLPNFCKLNRRNLKNSQHQRVDYPQTQNSVFHAKRCSPSAPKKRFQRATTMFVQQALRCPTTTHSNASPYEYRYRYRFRCYIARNRVISDFPDGRIFISNQNSKKNYKNHKLSTTITTKLNKCEKNMTCFKNIYHTAENKEATITTNAKTISENISFPPKRSQNSYSVCWTGQCCHYCDEG